MYNYIALGTIALTFVLLTDKETSAVIISGLVAFAYARGI